MLTPGPTQLPAQVYQALSRQIIHHRTPQFQQCLKEAWEGLKHVFQTQNDVYLLASSGTGAMEASVCNLLSPGDKVITVESGKFGERWTEICQAYEIEKKVIKIENGKAVGADHLRKIFQAEKNIKAVFTTLCETSTGVTTDIEAVAKVVRETTSVLVVDAISGLGATDLQTDHWGVDVVVAASHKGLMLPPGLGFISVNPKAYTLVERAQLPRYYFDLRLAKKALGKIDTPFTPAIHLVIALNESIKLIKQRGLANQFVYVARLAQATRQAARALGLTLFADESCISNVVTAIQVPRGIDGEALVKRMRDHYGISIAGGQEELKGKIIRIAHMGCLDEYDMLTGIACLEKVLKELDYPLVPGTGLSAAQKVFSENKSKLPACA